MDKIRVLLVDDAAVVRRLVTKALNEDPELEVAATAADGRMALDRVAAADPDVVLLDLEMPRLDGLATLAELRRTHPRLPVIMFSRFTQKGVEATVHALTLGADDYVPKPGDGVEVEHCIQNLLIPKIKVLGARHRSRRAGPSAVAPPATSAVSTRRTSAPNVEVLAIGTSTGGPNALAELVPALPADLPVPVLIVQHMPPDFTARLAERLAAKSRIAVCEGADGQQLTPGRAWVAPGNYHMAIHREASGGRLALNQDPPENSCRPAVDVLFRSAAAAYGPGVLAVVLTGMGEDGLRGCEKVRAAGGQILVQDEASSVVWSMPGAVARAGLADQALPLDQLAPAIVRRLQRPN
jgi:two-component system chemotaxis response regulator CheB